MTLPGVLLDELERTTAALATALDEDPEHALAARGAALERLAASAPALDRDQLGRLEAVQARGLALIEEARQRRAQLLQAVQEADAARHFAGALGPAGRQSVVDFTI